MIGLVVTVLIRSNPTATPQPIGGGELLIRKYEATIVADRSAPDWFTVYESAVVNQGRGITVSEPLYRVRAESAGFALEQVSISPLHLDSLGAVAVKIGHGAPLTGHLCDGICPPSTISVVDLSSNAFYRAGDEIVTANGATHSWSSSRIDVGVRFTYISNAWVPYRGIIQPFVGVSSIGGVVAALAILIWAALGAPWVFGAVRCLGDKGTRQLRAEISKRVAVSLPSPFWNSPRPSHPYSTFWITPTSANSRDPTA